MLSSLNLFIGFMFFMLIYGFYLKLWKQSKATFLIIFSFFLISLSARFVSIDHVLFESALVMFLLFIRAVFRKIILKSEKLRRFFYV